MPMFSSPILRRLAPPLLCAILAAAQAAGSPACAAPPGRAASKPVVLVVGDRFATALADGLDANPNIAVSRTLGDDFALTRPSFETSLPTIRERLARPDRPALAAVMVGTDDRAPLSDATGRFEPGSPGWARLYGERVDAVTELFKAAGVPLVWVGLPAVRSPSLSGDLVRQNGIIRDRAGADGVGYVDSFDGFTDAAGRYSATGPDVDGVPARLRRADGLGFTRAGARKLASFLAPDIARLGAAVPGAGDDVAKLTVERARGFDAALDIDVNAQIRREAAHGAGGPAVAVATGPATGPVLPLTAPATAPDGQLASLALPAGPPVGADPVAPKPGRADDFAWPRP